nr:GntR family transcriptional regulator [Chloroflexota bacterium]
MVELPVRRSKPTALTDWAYGVIKEAILTLKINPGAQLHIDELAEQLNISRTPVREALLRLEQDGLVRIVPRVGFFVTGITKRDLEELFELRELLESHAVKKATSALTESDIAYLKKLYQENAAAMEREDLAQFLQTEIEFHSFLINHAQNHWLITMMDSVQDLIHRERVLSLRSMENVRISVEEHQRILEALLQRDAELAGRRMGEHIRAVKERLSQFLDLPEE